MLHSFQLSQWEKSILHFISSLDVRKIEHSHWVMWLFLKRTVSLGPISSVLYLALAYQPDNTKKRRKLKREQKKVKGREREKRYLKVIEKRNQE